jgi:hypothetical protein
VQLKERLRMLETENKLLRGELDLKGALVFSANPTKLFNLGKLLGTGYVHGSLEFGIEKNFAFYF